MVKLYILETLNQPEQITRYNLGQARRTAKGLSRNGTLVEVYEAIFVDTGDGSGRSVQHGSCMIEQWINGQCSRV